MVGQPMTTYTQAVSTKTLLQLVADPRRRAILHHLIESDDDTIGLDKLTETIATKGGRTTIPCGSHDTQLEIELRHTHLPMLAEANIIEYDTRSDTIQYRPTDSIETLLQFVSAHLE